MQVVEHENIAENNIHIVKNFRMYAFDFFTFFDTRFELLYIPFEQERFSVLALHTQKTFE